jgi:hypothetical protein
MKDLETVSIRIEEIVREEFSREASSPTNQGRFP